MDKLKAGILGATGAAGLEFVRALTEHQWFEIDRLYASKKSAGKTLEEACSINLSDMPSQVRSMKIEYSENADYSLDFMCSALPSGIARKFEEMYAKHMPVISTSASFRYEDDVPIGITEVNPWHCMLTEAQKKRGWDGFIVPGPNCTTVGLVISLAPIYDAFGVINVIMSSYQAVSGGGVQLMEKWAKQKTADLPEPLEVGDDPYDNPEVLLEGNVIGHIEGEEEKVKKETLKILGDYENGTIRPASFNIDCSCVRVPTLQGHFETVFVELGKNCSIEDVKEEYRKFNEYCKTEFGELPSSPKETVALLDRSPQPRIDANIGGGMTVSVGRLEECDVFDHGIKYQVLSNNTEKGAAKGIVQYMEWMVKIGALGDETIINP